MKTFVKELVRTYGVAKPMNEEEVSAELPKFFLLRKFHGLIDLAIIFQTKRCQYQCAFCAIPSTSTRDHIDRSAIMSQFMVTCRELAHGLHLAERVSLSNDGSVLDPATFGRDALDQIIYATGALRGVREIHLESRTEFVNREILTHLKSLNKRVKFTILVGFETFDPTIRRELMRKNQELEAFEAAVAELGACGFDLGAFVLYKAHPDMVDDDAYHEAERSIDYLQSLATRHGLSVLVRLNPLYIAKGSLWDKQGKTATYVPPNLRDVYRLAIKKRAEGVRMFVGLSEEGLSRHGSTFRECLGYNGRVLQDCVRFNEDPTYLPTGVPTPIPTDV